MLSATRFSRLQFLATAVAGITLALLPFLSFLSAHLHDRNGAGSSPLPPYVLVEAALARTHFRSWPENEINHKKLSSAHVEKARNGSD